MRELDVDEKIEEVNKAYKNSIVILKKRIQTNNKLIEGYQKELSGIIIKMDQIDKKIEKIKDDQDNYFGKNKEFNLLPQKEKEIDILTIETEDLNNEKEIKGKAYKEIESLLRSQNEEWEKKLKKLEKERDEIKKSIVNQDFYQDVIVIAAYQKELREKEKINDEMVNQNIDNIDNIE